MTPRAQSMSAVRCSCDRKLSSLESFQRHFSAISGHMPAGMILLDPDANILQANRQMAEMCNKPDKSLIGCSLWSVVPKPPELQHLRELTDGDDGYSITCPLAVRDQGVAWGLLKLTTVHNAHQGEALWLGMMEDITSGVHAQDALHSLAERHNAAMAGARVGVFEWELSNNRITWHASMCQLLGYPRRVSIISEDQFLQHVHPDDRARLQENRLKRVEFGHGLSVRNEYRLLSENKGTLDVLMAAKVVYDPDGRPIRLVATAVDISKRKKLENELRKARLAAEQANDAKSAYLANVSHEIRTPMNAIMGFAQLLVEDPTLAGEHQSHAQRVLQAGQHLTDLINSVLELSKIEAGVLEMHPETFDLRETLASLEAMFASRAEEKGLHLTMELDDSFPKHILADPTRVRQALINVVGNAVKFTEKGSVRLHATAQLLGDIQCLTFRVCDTGPGVNPTDLARIFERFQRAEAKDVRYAGSGLGLAISRQICQHLGGDVTVSSEVGRGSEFVLTMNVSAVADEAETCERVPCSFAKSVTQATILIADDEPGNREVLRFLLGGRFQYLEAGDGESALRLIRQSKPDLVLLDLRMPILDGLGVLAAMNSMSGQPPVVAISAHALHEERDRMLAAGAAAYVSKPVLKTDLLETLARVMGWELEYKMPDTNAKAPDSPAIPLDRVKVRRLIQAIEHCDAQAVIDETMRLAVAEPAIAEHLIRLAQRFDFGALGEYASFLQQSPPMTIEETGLTLSRSSPPLQAAPAG